MEVDNFIYDGDHEWEAAKLSRIKSQDVTSSGINFIDRITNGGFVYNDLVIISSDSGVGKTEIACTLAENFADNGKKVLYFGLEMAYGEGLNRIGFRKLAKILKNSNNFDYISYGLFKQNKLKYLLDKHDMDMHIAMENVLENILWRRKSSSFTLFDLKRELLENKDKADVFIIDHLSMVDTDSVNENKEAEIIMKEIDMFCEQYEKPVIIVAHIRKSQGNTRLYMPRLHDILGSKHIVNIPKIVIMLAKDYETQVKNDEYPTYIRFLKNRDSGRTNYVGRIYFNYQTSSYKPDFELLLDKGNGVEVANIDTGYPTWANKI